MNLARDCYFLTKSLPKEDLYGLTSQLRRAAISVPANIAEGNGRKTRRDYVNFLRIAQGSLRELQTYLLFVAETHLIEQEMTEPLLLQVESVARLLNRLIQALESPPP
jgi:four helix bundle protein